MTPQILSMLVKSSLIFGLILLTAICFLFWHNISLRKKIKDLSHDFYKYEDTTNKKINACLIKFIEYLGEVTSYIKNNNSLDTSYNNENTFYTDNADDTTSYDDEKVIINVLEKLFTDAIKNQKLPPQ